MKLFEIFLENKSRYVHSQKKNQVYGNGKSLQNQ